MTLKIRTLALSAAAAVAGLMSIGALADDKANLKTYWEITNLRTYWDIQKHFGVVPKFFQQFPEARLPNLWNEYKRVQLNPDTALDAKTKQLIGLAVAVQSNCIPCVYFQSAAAIANGASGKDLQETVAIAVIGGNWSKILKPELNDMVKKDTDTLVSIGTLTAKPKPTAVSN